MATLRDPTRRNFLISLAGAGAVLATRGPALGSTLSAQATLPRLDPGTEETLPIVGLGSSKPVLEIPTEGTEPLAAVRCWTGGGSSTPRTRPSSTVLRHAQMRQALGHWKRATRSRACEIWMKPVAVFRVVRKDSGEARYGVTVSSTQQHDQFESFMRAEPLDFIQVNYSVMESGAEERILPLARDLGMGVLINRPFMNGSYFGRVSGRTLPEWASEFDCASWAQFSLKYILAHPAVTCALTETTNPEHMEDNLQAAFGRLPDDATKRRMRELVQDF